MENCQKNRFCSAVRKVAIDIRDALVMFVRGMCFFQVVVFSKSMLCKYFHVRSNLDLNCFVYLLGKSSSC